jgi:N6-adenosine-specific RNA methylase IME4
MPIAHQHEKPYRRTNETARFRCATDHLGERHGWETIEPIFLMIESPTTLSRYDAACRALAEAKSLDEVMEIADKATALKEYYRRAKDRTAEIHMAELRVEAERRWGQMFGEIKSAGLVAKAAPGNQYTGPVPQGDRSTVTLAGLGTDKKFSARAQKLASIPEATFRKRLASARAKAERDAGRVTMDILREVAQEQRRADHAARLFAGGTVDDLDRLVAGGFKFAAILADPPWKFITHNQRGEGRSANQHYRTGALDSIKALPVAQLAADNAVLCMWMVDWCPGAALEVIEAWGFEHKTTAFTWAKQNESGEGWHTHGPGLLDSRQSGGLLACYTRQPGTALCRRAAAYCRSRLEHSRKPDEAHDGIERLTEGPYLELYARRERRGWMTWGDELALNVPDAIPRDPETGNIKEVPFATEPSSVESPRSSNADDGLALPDLLRRGHPACIIGAADDKTSTQGVVSI